MADLALWMNFLEVMALVSGLVCVWLLIRENIWTFPIGMVYALISVIVFSVADLYADVLLSSYYVAMNAYGWYYWRRGGRSEGDAQAPVQNMPKHWWYALIPLCGLGIFVMGYLFSNYTQADLAYWDSTTTLLSFVAMWMTARKYIENWIVWFIVDLLSTGIYWYKGLEGYSLLYGIYLIMAVMGWRAWHRTLKAQALSV